MKYWNWLVLIVFISLFGLFSIFFKAPSAVIAATYQSGTSTPAPAVSSSEPLVFADVTSNCREGPSTGYKVVGWLVEGNSTTIYGRDVDRHWWYVKNPTRDGYCWVWAHSTYTDGNMGNVPLVESPPVLLPEDEDYWCALTLCFHGEDELVYCSCRRVQKKPQTLSCFNNGCPGFPWWR